MEQQQNSNKYPCGRQKRCVCGRRLCATSTEGLARGTEAQVGEAHRRSEEAPLYDKCLISVIFILKYRDL